jgi:hypothetical protein
MMGGVQLILEWRNLEILRGTQFGQEERASILKMKHGMQRGPFRRVTRLPSRSCHPQDSNTGDVARMVSTWNGREYWQRATEVYKGSWEQELYTDPPQVK